MELRYALGAFVIGAALATAALAGCLGDDRDASDDAREGGAPASSAELEDYPPRPEHSRSQPLSDAEILDGGDEIRAFYVSSSDHRPCGFAIGDNGQAVVVVLQTTDPAIVRADLRPRCVDLALPSPRRRDLELVLAASPDERHASLLDEVGREQLVGHERCCNARPVQGATIDVD